MSESRGSADRAHACTGAAVFGMISGGRGEDGFGRAPVVGERARWWSAVVGAAGDSERRVVVFEEVELPVLARAFGIATFAERVVVASDLSEVCRDTARREGRAALPDERLRSELVGVVSAMVLGHLEEAST